MYQIIYNLVPCYPSQLKLFLTQSPIFTDSPSLKPLCRCLLKPYWPFCFSKVIKTLPILLTLPKLLFSPKAKDILSSLTVYGILPSSGIWLLFFFKTFIWYLTLSAVHHGFSLVSYLVLCVSVPCFPKEMVSFLMPFGGIEAGIQSSSCGTGLLELTLWHHHLPTVWPWVCYLILMCLSFSTCQKMIIVPSFVGLDEWVLSGVAYWFSTCEILKTVPAM